MLALLRIIRPINLAFLAFAIVGVILLGYQVEGALIHPRISHFWLVILFVYVLCSVTASGYVINDYFDVKTDAINKPHRQIVGKILNLRDTRILYFGLLLDGIIFSSLLFWFSGKFFFTPIVFLTQILLFVYAKYLKKSFLIGNLIVATLTIVPYFLILYIFEFGFVLQVVVALLSISGFFLNLTREVVKDWEDTLGDLTIGAQTLPIRFGENRTKKVVLALLKMSILILLVFIGVYVFFNPNMWYVLALFWPFIAIIVLQTQMIRRLRDGSWSPTKVSKNLKICMFLGVVWVYNLMLALNVLLHTFAP